jgi:hypothetical protein
MDDDEFAASVFEAIQDRLRADAQTTVLANEILDEANQGKFERKGVSAPRYDDSEKTYVYSAKPVRRSKQEVTVSQPYTNRERALIAVTALRRAFFEPRLFSRHLESLSDVKTSPITTSDREVIPKEHLIKHPLMRFSSSTDHKLKLTFSDPRQGSVEHFSDLTDALTKAEIDALEAVVFAVEERLR